nr:hypothetical protein [Tanacetum cinerariifolium]
GPYALSWKPCLGDSLNLPDHSLVPAKSNSYYQSINVKSQFGEIDYHKKSQVNLKGQIKVIHAQGELTTLKCHIKAQNQESRSMNKIMSSITSQQTKLDQELVPKEKRLEIGKCNGRINPGKKQREPTFQVVLDALALTLCYFAFLTTADVPEVYMHQFGILSICLIVHGQNFDELPTYKDIVSFFKDGHTGEIKTITDIVVDQMHQPWRTFATIINRSLSDFSAYIKNGLKITNLTQETLLGPAFRLLKGTHTNYVELEYDFKECYKALSEKLDWDNLEGSDYPFDLTKPLPLVMNGNRQIVLVEYFFNNDLKYLQGGISTMMYTTSITKTKATQYDTQALKTWSKTFGVLLKSPMIDMHFGVFHIGEINVKPTMGMHEAWNPLMMCISTKLVIAVTRVKVMQNHRYGYLREIEVRRADNDLYTFKEGDFPRLRINDIEDILILIKHGYSKESRRSLAINVTKPETTRPGIRKKDPYTSYQDPQGFIYVETLMRNSLMRSDELYKFSDGTLTRFRTLLDDITKNIRMDYLPQRRWSTLEKKRANIMIKAIDKQLKRKMDDEEPQKFVGGEGKQRTRAYKEDDKVLKLSVKTKFKLHQITRPRPRSRYEADIKAINLILLSIPNDIYNSVDACENAKDMWDRVKRLIAKRAAKTHDPLTLVPNTYASSSSFRSLAAHYVTRPPSVVDYDEDYQGDAICDNQIEELKDMSANICMMARIQQADNDSKNESSYDSAFISEVHDGKFEHDKNVHDQQDNAMELLARNAYREGENNK